jgi:D-alanyl-D-alanine carboxypeptidase
MIRRFSAVVLAAALALPGTAWAASSTAGDATPNFTESSGCGTYGLRGPLSATNTIGTKIYGPFGDFYGRDYGQVSGSIRTWVEPSGRTLRVHQRLLGPLDQAKANVYAAGTSYRVTDGSGWVWRNVGGSDQMSQHATGSAVDFNPASNPYRYDGSLVTNIPSAWVQAFRSAGMCWGGDWLVQKDPMHFSWRGPAASGGLTPRLAPYPALTAAARFSTLALEVSSGIPQDGASTVWAMADRRRDGADDLYSVRLEGGRKQVQVAGAISRFATVGIRRDSTASTGGIDLLSDGDGDGRADLWRFETGSGSLVAEMFSDASRFGSRAVRHVTNIPWSADAELGLAMYDWADWVPDLYVIRRNSGKVEVYSGASGFSVKLLESTLPFSPGADALVLADRDLDGTTDVWSVGSGPSAMVRIAAHNPALGYGQMSEVFASSMTVGAGTVVLPGDWDGDGRVDLYLVSGGRVQVWLGGVPDRPIGSLTGWFMPKDPAYFDAGPVCASTCDSVGYVNPGGRWSLAHKFEWGPLSSAFYYGNPGDVPFMGDWDGDGVDTPGLYRRSDGYVYLRNSNTQGIADTKFFFGNPGDLPLVGDWDGDGRDTVSIYRPSEARFYVVNRLGSADKGLGAADFFFDFGDPGDAPFAGDLDGDGVDEVGLHRVSSGKVYYRTTLTTGVAEVDFIYGDPGDVVVAGDWDGDGRDTVGLYRPSNAYWFIRLSNSQGVADHAIPFGLDNATVLPVVGKFGGLGPAALTISECIECVATGS